MRCHHDHDPTLWLSQLNNTHSMALLYDMPTSCVRYEHAGGVYSVLNVVFRNVNWDHLHFHHFHHPISHRYRRECKFIYFISFYFSSL
jgi:hypothetical protein